MAGWVRALLFLLGGVVAAGGTAYLTGLLDPWLSARPAAVAEAPAQPEAPSSAADHRNAAGDGATDQAAADGSTPGEAPREEEVAPQEAAESQPGEAVTTTKQDRLVQPNLDLLRVEPDGSVVVAGKAGPKALVELLLDDKVLGSTTSGAEGDFVIVPDGRLDPGDYRLALRATTPGDEGVLSAESAIISIPEKNDGQVLAMVEAPGEAAELVTVPQPAAAATAESQPVVAIDQDGTLAPATEQANGAAGAAGEITSEAAESEAAETEAAGNEAAAETAPGSAINEQGEAQSPVVPAPAVPPAVVVEAVEIEGDTIFVAGRAAAGHAVRIYADAIHLGDAVISAGERFLVEARRALAVGNYIIRADLIDKDGNVLARASVPFEREPGEAIAAVAPPAAQAQSDQPVALQAGQAGEAAPEGQVEAAGSGAEGTQNADAETADAETAGAGSTAARDAKDEGSSTVAAPAGDGDVTAAPLQRADGAVIIRRGDSLWRISRRVYGQGIRYSTIYLANQDQINDPDRIWPGQVFTLPHETPEGEQADLEAIGDQAVEPQQQDHSRD